MELLTRALQATLPALYSQEGTSDPTVYVKFFTPDAGWTWYITEGSKQADGDWLLFGYVVGLDAEWGYVLLSELQAGRGPMRLGIERDLSFQPIPFSKLEVGR